MSTALRTWRIPSSWLAQTLSGWLICLALAATALASVGCGASAEVDATALPAPLAGFAEESAVESIDNPEQLPTNALKLEGDQRIAEPARRAERRGADEAPQTWVMPLYERPYPRIASVARGSISLGTVTAGALADAAELPIESTEVRVLDLVAQRNTRFTTHEMRDLLVCAAKEVAKVHPGRVLQLGNLSRLGGGPLPWSVSHNNGRDADLAFYALDDQGKPAKSDRLYHFDRRLRSTDSEKPLSFDVAANWTFVKALLTCKGPDIQYLFIAQWLKQPMLVHAQKHKEDKELVARAAAILHQPKKALAHNDHLHLRIGCSSDDTGEGCVNASRAPQAAWGRSSGVQARLPAIRQALQSGTAEQRAQAVQLIGLYRDSESLPVLLQAAADPEAQVRLAVAKALGSWNPAGGDQALADALVREIDPSCAFAQLSALAEMGAAARLADALADRRVLYPPTSALATPLLNIRKIAVNLLGYSGSLLGARAALQLLDDDQPAVRDEARDSLERLTNFSTVDLMADLAGQLPQRSWSEPLDPTGEKLLWTTFLDSLPQGITRQELALRGLARRGIAVAGLDRQNLAALAQALALPTPWRDNAAQWISQIVAHRPGIGTGARVRPAQFWSTWLLQRRLVAASEIAVTLAQLARPPAAPTAASGAPSGSGPAGGGGALGASNPAAASDDD